MHKNIANFPHDGHILLQETVRFSCSYPTYLVKARWLFAMVITIAPGCHKKAKDPCMSRKKPSIYIYIYFPLQTNATCRAITVIDSGVPRRSTRLPISSTPSKPITGALSRLSSLESVSSTLKARNYVPALVPAPNEIYAQSSRHPWSSLDPPF